MFGRKRSRKPSTGDPEMDAFVDSLRRRHELDAEPDGMTKAERNAYRRAKKQVGDAVVDDVERGFRRLLGKSAKRKRG